MRYNKEKGRFVRIGCPFTYDKEELLVLYSEYKTQSFWNDEDDTIKAFCEKREVGYDTMRRYLGLKPQNWRKTYPKDKQSS